MTPHRSLSFRQSQMEQIVKWQSATTVFNFNEAIRQLVELGLAASAGAGDAEPIDDAAPLLPVAELPQVTALTISYAPGWRKWINAEIAAGRRVFTREELFARLPDQNRGQASTPREIDAYFAHCGWIGTGTIKRVYRAPG